MTRLRPMTMDEIEKLATELERPAAEYTARPRSEAEGTRAPACHCGDMLRERPCPFCSPEAYYGAGRAPVPAESATRCTSDGTPENPRRLYRYCPGTDHPMAPSYCATTPHDECEGCDEPLLASASAPSRGTDHDTQSNRSTNPQHKE